MRHTLWTLAAVAALLATAGTANAQLRLDWWTVDGGGVINATGGTLSLSGTIGQPDASTPMVGGGLMLTGGFWGAAHVLPGDCNGDGIVDVLDVIEVVSAFSTTPVDPGWEPCADFNQNGIVDVTDVILVVNQFGRTL